MNTQRAVAQTRARDGLPRAFDRQLLDLPTQPIDPEARAHFVVSASGFDDACAMLGREHHDIERSVVRVETRHSAGQFRWNACVEMLLADFLEALAIDAN